MFNKEEQKKEIIIQSSKQRTCEVKCSIISIERLTLYVTCEFLNIVFVIFDYIYYIFSRETFCKYKLFILAKTNH